MLWARLYAALLDDYANKQRLLDELDQILPFDELRETVGAAMYEQRFVGLADADLEAMTRRGKSWAATPGATTSSQSSPKQNWTWILPSAADTSPGTMRGFTVTHLVARLRFQRR